jgi:hypothetical protein
MAISTLRSVIKMYFRMTDNAKCSFVFLTLYECCAVELHHAYAAPSLSFRATGTVQYDYGIHNAENVIGKRKLFPISFFK